MKSQTFNRVEKKKEKISKAEKVYNAIHKDKLRAAASRKKEPAV